MTNDSLNGIATWDAHRSCWVPEHGKQDEAAARLGDGWTFDEYYGAFFANPGTETPKQEPVSNHATDAFFGIFGMHQALQRRAEFLKASAEVAAGKRHALEEWSERWDAAARGSSVTPTFDAWEVVRALGATWGQFVVVTHEAEDAARYSEVPMTQELWRDLVVDIWQRRFAPTNPAADVHLTRCEKCGQACGNLGDDMPCFGIPADPTQDSVSLCGSCCAGELSALLRNVPRRGRDWVAVLPKNRRGA